MKASPTLFYIVYLYSMKKKVIIPHLLPQQHVPR